MKQQHFTRYEKKSNRAILLEKNLAGEGIYIFENPNNATLKLPRPTKSGLRIVGPKQQFQGDNYYMHMVKSHDLRLIAEIQSPEAERKANQMEEKLILDQPEIVTDKGQIEHVVPAKAGLRPAKKKLNDATENEAAPPKEVLLTEDPMAGVEIVVD
jgi:hypothetical protein